jgi:hypothetical protein
LRQRKKGEAGAVCMRAHARARVCVNGREWRAAVAGGGGGGYLDSFARGDTVRDVQVDKLGGQVDSSGESVDHLH